MKKYDTILRNYEDQVLISTTCDICKKTVKGASWASKEFETADVEVSMQIGTVYSAQEGGDITKTEFDICPQCFKEVLIPFLKSLGAEPAETEESW